MILTKLPMPPSVNASLRSIHKTGRFVKTEASTMFDKHIISYRAINWRKIDEISKFLKDWIKEDRSNVIHLQRIFHFNEKRIYTKTKKALCMLREFDTENFMKLSTDSISLLLDIDDRYFKSQSIETIAIGNDRPEFIYAEFRIMKMRNYDQFK